MLFYLLLLCALFSTTFCHQDGIEILTHNTRKVTVTSKNTTLIKLGHGLQNSYELLDFWIRKDTFNFYIDAKECIDKKASTSFIIGGGNVITLDFNLTKESLNESKVDVSVWEKHDVEVHLENGKIKITVNLGQKHVVFNDTRMVNLTNTSYQLGEVAAFPFHHGREPRVSFFVFNDGKCKITYEMSNEMIPLTVSHHRAATPLHHPDATTPNIVNGTELPEKWYERSTYQKVGYAYMWVLSCAIAFMIGLCAGQSQPRTHRTQVRSVEVASTTV
uniref:Uncharacterized protein n=1 Tax=Panagrolaimus sp. ES5 TaxID=591445 RepID=A0AC34F8K1_9BILA